MRFPVVVGLLQLLAIDVSLVHSSNIAVQGERNNDGGGILCRCEAEFEVFYENDGNRIIQGLDKVQNNVLPYDYSDAYQDDDGNYVVENIKVIDCNIMVKSLLHGEYLDSPKISKRQLMWKGGGGKDKGGKEKGGKEKGMKRQLKWKGGGGKEKEKWGKEKEKGMKRQLMWKGGGGKEKEKGKEKWGKEKEKGMKRQLKWWKGGGGKEKEKGGKEKEKGGKEKEKDKYGKRRNLIVSVDDVTDDDSDNDDATISSIMSIANEEQSIPFECPMKVRGDDAKAESKMHHRRRICRFIVVQNEIAVVVVPDCDKN